MSEHQRVETATDFDDYTPFPYDEAEDPDRFWKPDPFDSCLPKQKGFITDLVYYMRGMEVPTLFSVWSAIWLLSTCIKREAWLKWFPQDLYANLYMILVGPAGCRKSTTIDDIGVPLVKMLHKYMQDPNVKRMKNINIIKDKMTPESALNGMVPGNKPGKQSFAFVDDEGKPIMDPKTNKPLRYKATSETGLVLSEMGSSVGKRSYTDGFIEILLDLYNPRDTYEWTTISRGKQVLKRTYLTLLAATTPTGFRDSIPQAALGDGFLSRSILVYQPSSNRRFSVPRPVPNGPSIEELAKRLAWICETSIGEFSLDPDAFDRYDSWYHEFKDYLEANVEEQGFRSRMYLNVLKVALLLRAQRYDMTDRTISLEDMNDAINLMQITYAKSVELLSEVGGDEFNRAVRRVLSVMKRHRKVDRTTLLRKSHIPAAELNQVLDQLAQLGEIKIKRDGKYHLYPSRVGEELYIYCKQTGEEEDET